MYVDGILDREIILRKGDAMTEGEIDLLKNIALKIYQRLTLEELQTLVAVAIDVLTDNPDGIDDMLEKIPDGSWDAFYEGVLCEPRGGD